MRAQEKIAKRLSFTRENSNGWYGYKLCPYCKTDKEKFGIQWTVQRYHCFRCGQSGSLNQLLRYLGIPLLVKRVTQPERTRTRVSTALDLEKLGWVRLTGREQGSPGREVSAYLRSRGVDLELWEVGLCPRELYGRAVWLFRTAGVPVYYQARRVVLDVGPKTLNPPPGVGCHPDHALLGFDLWRPGFELVLVEGPFDAAAATDLSRNRLAVPLLGKQLSREKLLALKNLGVDRVTCFLDSDAQDFQALLALQLSKAGLTTSYVRWIGHEGDPSSLGAEKCQHLLDLSVGVTPASRLRLLAFAAPLVRRKR